MKLMGISINIGHSIYLPGINQETFDIDGSVRVYYGSTISIGINNIEFSGSWFTPGNNWGIKG